jgi:AraC-like DNA-binding protein
VLTGVSPHQLSEFINDHYHKNFASFINEYRVKKAKELLLSPNNCTMIAAGYDSGFNSKSAFNSAFRKSENMSPGEFRRKNIF